MNHAFFASTIGMMIPISTAIAFISFKGTKTTI
jgi:hypothetical protein